MTASEAIVFLQRLEAIAEGAESPVDAMITLGKVVATTPKVTQELHGQTERTVSRWIGNWGRSSPTYAYRQCGGYDSFLAYKYQMRRGVKVDEIPDKLREIIERSFANMPMGGTEYEHNTSPLMLREASYDSD